MLKGSTQQPTRGGISLSLFSEQYNALKIYHLFPTQSWETSLGNGGLYHP